MKLNKRLQLKFANNDIYMLEHIANHFLINKNNRRILVLDENLNIINSIGLNRSVGIQSILYGDNGNNILVYCPNEDVLVYCNMLNKKSKSIHINALRNCHISPIYHSDASHFLMSTYEKDFYIFDCTKKKLKQVSEDFIHSNYPNFYNFWQVSQLYYPKYQVSWQQQSFIFKDEINKQIIYFDYKNNIKTAIRDPEIGYHDIVFYNGYFVFVAEKLLTIAKDGDTYHYPMDYALYIFLRVRCMIEDGKLCMIVLIGNNSDHMMSLLIKYELL